MNAPFRKSLEEQPREKRNIAGQFEMFSSQFSNPLMQRGKNHEELQKAAEDKQHWQRKLEATRAEMSKLQSRRDAIHEILKSVDY